jgi:hypothetical protein
LKIIGFGHRSGMGKDTAAKFLDTHLRATCPKLKVRRISFADKLKDVTYSMYAWAGIRRPIEYENNRALRSEPIAALGGITIVDLWVLVGEKMREVYPKTWLHYLTKTDHKVDVVIVADVRHPNEADEIVDEPRDWRCYKVHNPRIPYRETIPGAKSIDHMLESYDRWSGIIDNSSDLEFLHTQVKNIGNELIEKWSLKRG